MIFKDNVPRENIESREIERNIGRIEEQDRQRESLKAMELGKKQGKEEEQAREKRKGWPGKSAKVLILLVVFAIIVLVAAYLTLSVSIYNSSPGISLPFTTKYGVSFPQGQPIKIGNTHINVLSYQNELISDIDGDRQKLEVGGDRTISERRAIITTLGVITLMDTNFQINLNYKGDRDNRAYFDMMVHTSQQVPDMLVKQLLPPDMDARPI